MAIINELGLEVKVLIRGRPCLEYEDDSLFRNFDDIDQHTLACYRWVESQQDEVFAMYFRVLPGGPASTWLQEEDNGVAFSTSFDGSNAVENYIAYRDSPSVDDTETERVAKDREIAKELGLIRVFVRRVVMKGMLEKGTEVDGPVSELTEAKPPLAEKALKGKVVSLGTTISNTPAPIQNELRSVRIKWVDCSQSPYAVFYLKYRSTDDLQTQMIIPRPRFSSPKHEDDLDALPAEELRRMLREMRAQIKRSASVKVEDTIDQGTRQIKRSASVKEEDDDDVNQLARPVKYTRLEDDKNGIDSTEDD